MSDKSEEQIEQELQKWKNLLNKGHITEQEFQIKRAEVLQLPIPQTQEKKQLTQKDEKELKLLISEAKSRVSQSDQAEFVALRKLYLDWKGGNLNLPVHLSLPDLKTYPKDFDRPKHAKHIIREVALKIFEEIEKFDTDRSNNVGKVTYGLYTAGPFGVGKSGVMYLTACLARSLGWIVVYVPRCDEWAASSDHNQYLIDQFKRSLEPFLDVKVRSVAVRTEGITTWGELLYSAELHLDKPYNVVHKMFYELQGYTDRPVLLIFDEVNALYDNKLQDAEFFRFAAHFNRIVMERGWKLISGTGHSKFIRNIPSGLQTYVRPFEPWTDEEFNLLMDAADLPPSLRDLLSNPNWKKQLCVALGNVPRHLSDLAKLVPTLEASKETQLHRRFLGIMGHYLTIMETFFENTNYIYLQQLDDVTKHSHISTLISLFTFNPNIRISYDFFDLSLIYYNRKLNRCLPITPVAGNALVSNLRKFFALTPVADSDVALILQSSMGTDEKTRAFERVLVKAALFVRDKLDHCKLDGTDEKALPFQTITVLPIPEGELLPEGGTPPIYPALYVPQSRQYPIADFIHVDPQRRQITILQLTVSTAAAKVPYTSTTPGHTASVYSAIHDKHQWVALLQNNFPSRKSKYQASNYGEQLLASLLGITAEVSVQGGELKVVEKNLSPTATGPSLPPPVIVYIIVTSRPKDQSNSGKLTRDFPWVRVMYPSQLSNFLTPEIVACLQV